MFDPSGRQISDLPRKTRETFIVTKVSIDISWLFYR
jgi:hypothetical protein